MPIHEWARTRINAHGAYPADDDAVIVTREHFLNLAIKRGEAVLEDGCAS